jgi:LPXTG-motif cell wall-anchored protein
VTVTTTPKVVTTVQTVTGKVWHINPPGTVILRLEDGTNQQFKIPKGQKFMVNGQETDAWGLRKGMNVSATKIVEVPETEVQHQQQVTGSAPPPPPAPAPDAPILVASAAPAPAPAQAEAPAELPATGSSIPLMGLLGGFLVLSSFGMRLARRFF